MKTKHSPGCPCCCPLIECPWDTATVSILGMEFSVDFPPPDDTCCQRETSVCDMVGPDLVRDCFVTQFDWTLINPGEFLSMTGPFCDWPLVVVPFTAVDSCCDSTNYRVEWRGRFLRRSWFWMQARVKFIVCYCLTPEGLPGYRVRLEMEYRRSTISNTTRLIKYRNRKYTRICCDAEEPGDPPKEPIDPILFGEPVGGGGSTIDCVPGCYSNPPEPGWNDPSGDEIPAAPPLRHPALALAGCDGIAALTPVFDPICIGTCDEENDLIEGCYDAGPYQIISDCELVDIQSCSGTASIRLPSRWQIVGETPTSTSETGTLIWESGVADLSPACTEDTGFNELTVPVSRGPTTWTLLGPECFDSSGTDQGPYNVVVPQLLEVLLTRSCANPIEEVE